MNPNYPTQNEIPLRLTYRQEVVDQIMKCVMAGDSSVLVGMPSCGKSNLLRFLLRADVQQHYLGSQAAGTVFLLIDSNSLIEMSEYGVYELILNRILDYIDDHIEDDGRSTELHRSYREAIVAQNWAMIQRSVESAIGRLCTSMDRRLVLLFDEFDELLQNLDRRFFLNLRSIRDNFKYRICYVVAMRGAPTHVRDDVARDCEPFYELLSSNMFGLKPYTQIESLEVVRRLERRRGLQLSGAQSQLVVELSGGHPGLIAAIVEAGSQQRLPEDLAEVVRLCLSEPLVQDECTRIWSGLNSHEQGAVVDVARRQPIASADPSMEGYLEAKGIILRDGSPYQKSLFSPLFEKFVLDLRLTMD